MSPGLDQTWLHDHDERDPHLVRPGRRVAWHDLTPEAPAGAPVVLLSHAAPGDGSFDPDPAVTAAHGVRLVAPDRPGYGGSDPVGADEFASIDLAADDAAALLDELLAPGGTAGVVGWSAGGRVALALAARRPELVDRVAVLGSPARTSRCRGSGRVPARHRRVARGPGGRRARGLTPAFDADARPADATPCCRWSGWRSRTRWRSPARARETGCARCSTARRRRVPWAWSRTSPATRCGRGDSTRPMSPSRCCSATAWRTNGCRRPTASGTATSCPTPGWRSCPEWDTWSWCRSGAPRSTTCW